MSLYFGVYMWLPGAEEGVPGETSSVYVPRGLDGSYVIDRDGAAFRYVLVYLRDLEC